MANYFITGASGFVAGHLMELVLKSDKDARITGVDISKAPRDVSSVFEDVRVSFFGLDMLDVEALEGTLKDARPDFIVHLAAYSSVAFSWSNPISSFTNNMNIFLNLLEIVRRLSLNARILSVGSSEQYGIVAKESVPLKETEPLNPISPYAVARVAQEGMGCVYAKGYGMNIVMTRSFNHFGPGQRADFVLSGFAKQLAEIKKGKREPVIHVGNLEVVRDLIDVRDVVRAYCMLLRSGTAGEIYNVCSGNGNTVRKYLDAMIGISGVSCSVEQRKDLLRPVDNPIIIGDNGKLRGATGWTSDIPLEKGLKDLYDYWLSRV